MQSWPESRDIVTRSMSTRHREHTVSWIGLLQVPPSKNVIHTIYTSCFHAETGPGGRANGTSVLSLSYIVQVPKISGDCVNKRGIYGRLSKPYRKMWTYDGTTYDVTALESPFLRYVTES